MMKTRLAPSNQADLGGAFQSTKNGSLNRGADKSGGNSKNHTGNQQHQVGAAILNSEERRKLFNTFMKEMNQSIVAQNLNSSNTKKKKAEAP